MDTINIDDRKVNFEFIQADLTQKNINSDEERRRLANVIQEEKRDITVLPTEELMTTVALSGAALAYIQTRNSMENSIISNLNTVPATFTNGILTWFTKLITESIQAASKNTQITICIIIFSGVVCCAVYDSTLPEEQQSTFIPKLKELIDRYISQRNQELIKKVALTPVAVVGGGVQGALLGVGALYGVLTGAAFIAVSFYGGLSVVAPSLVASAAAAQAAAGTAAGSQATVSALTGFFGGAGAFLNIGRVTTNLWEKGEIDLSNPFDKSKKNQ